MAKSKKTTTKTNTKPEKNTAQEDFKKAVKELIKDSKDVSLKFNGNNWTLSGTKPDNYAAVKEVKKELS
jgi:hypothetical protein